MPRVVSLVLLLLGAWPFPAKAQSVTEWRVQATEKREIRISPSSNAGSVSLVTYYPVPFQGSFASWFATEVDRFAAELHGVTRRTGIETQESPIGVGANRTLFKVSIFATKSDGLKVAAIVAGYVTTDGQAQMLAILHPEQMPASDPNYASAYSLLDMMWHMGQAAGRPVDSPPAATAPPALTPPATTAGPTPPVTSEPPAASEPSGAAPIASARNFADIRNEHNQGLAIVAPCEPGQIPILTTVFRRHSSFNTNLAQEVTGESQRLTQWWTRGGPVSFGPVRGDGQAATRTATFRAGDANFAAWFTAIKGSGYYVHRAYVVVPAHLANDERFAAAIRGARQMMVVSGWPSVEAAGTPPSATAGTEIEAVLSLSGLLFANDGSPLSAAPIEVALWKNGAAAESKRGYSGRWSRIPGGYAVAFQGGHDASIVHLSDTCRTGKSTRLSRPPLPPVAVSDGASCHTRRMENGLYPTRQCSPTSCQTIWVNTYGDYSFCD